MSLGKRRRCRTMTLRRITTYYYTLASLRHTYDLITICHLTRLVPSLEILHTLSSVSYDVLWSVSYLLTGE